jgi:hypothetical protein
MFIVDFWQHLKRYNRERLPELRIQTHEFGVKGGLFLVSRDQDRADLMFAGRRLGSVVWRGGEIVYEPPIDNSEGLSLEGHLDRWVAQAWRKAQSEQDVLAA